MDQSQSSQLSKSLRLTRGENILNNSRNKQLENSQLYMQKEMVTSTQIDQKNITVQPQQLAFSQNVKIQNFKGAANDLLTQEDGTEETRHIRQIERLYIQELRKQLDFNRTVNEELRLKNSINQSSSVKYQHLMSQSMRATESLSSIPGARERMLAQMEERQISLDQKLRQENQQYQSFLEQKRLQEYENYDQRIRGEEYTQQYLSTLKLAREKNAIQGNIQLQQSYQQQQQRVALMRSQQIDELNQSSSYNMQRLFGGRSLKTQRDAELNAYKQERLELQKAKIDASGRARSAYYAQLSRQAADSIPDGQAKYSLVQGMKIAEKQAAAEQLQSEYVRAQRQLAQNRMSTYQDVNERSELMDLRHQYASQVLQQTAAQKLQKQREMEQHQDMTKSRQQQDQNKAQEMDRKRQHVDAATRAYIFRNSSTHAFSLDIMDPGLKSSIQPNSILALSREDAMKRVLDFENNRHSIYRDVSRVSQSQSQRLDGSQSLNFSVSHQIDTNQIASQDSAHRTELPAITRSQLITTQPVTKSQIQFQAAQEQDQKIKQLRAQHNKTMMELLQLEKQRNLQRAEALRSAPTSQREQLKSVYETEQAAFQKKVKLLDDRLQEQIALVQNNPIGQ